MFGLEAISGAASIALASALLALLLVKALHVAAIPLNRGSSFSSSIMIEAAQRFREEAKRLASERAVYITGNLVFAATFIVAFALRPQQIFGDLPLWQHVMMLLLVFLSLACMIYRLSKLVIAAHHVAYIRDASIATGHGLQKLTGNRNRVFHDVRCAAGFIDHLVVGLHGIYAVEVIARRPGSDNRVRLQGDELEFAPDNVTMSLARFGVKVKQLSVQFRKCIGHEVNIRKVIAVPGWEIDSQTSSGYLVVNERMLMMMRGWKDQRDYLMHEDVDLIQKALTENGFRSPE